MNELSVTEQESILALLRLGWSVRRVARETGRRHETIRRYGQQAGVLPIKAPLPVEAHACAIAVPAGSPEKLHTVATDKPRTAAGEVPADLAEKPRTTAAAVPPDPASKPHTPATEVPTDLASKPHTAMGEVPTDFPAQNGAQNVASAVLRSRSSCSEHAAFIEAGLAKGRNATAIYQDLVEHHAYDGSYDAVKRFARRIRPADPKISCRFETEIGAEQQVDYGEGAPTRHPRTGKYRKPRLFIMTLGFSRHRFCKVVWNSSSQIWCELHEEAFAYFGGAARLIRLDNLREGIVDPDIYDPELNGLYAAMLAHYSVVAIPCRPYAPDLKGKVESAVGHTQGTALKGRTFESIEEQNVFLQRWNERWAFTRIHGTTKRQVREMFDEERPALLPLPSTRFEYYQIVERRVHVDAHIEVNGAYYSAPPRYVGTSVVVHVGTLWLRIIDARSKLCVREHVIIERGRRQTVQSDLPKQTPPQVHRLVAHVGGAGPSCRAFASALEADRGALALRPLFGLVDLIKRYGIERVDRACALAMSAGSLRLRFVRKALTINDPEPTLIDEHKLIESISTYRKHFNALTQGDLFDDQ
jgi:transposase